MWQPVSSGNETQEFGLVLGWFEAEASLQRRQLPDEPSWAEDSIVLLFFVEHLMKVFKALQRFGLLVWLEGQVMTTAKIS